MEYSYKPPLIKMLVSTLFFAACSFVLFQMASKNDKGALLENVIKLDVNTATILLWFLFGSSILLCLCGILGAMSSITNPRKLTLDEHQIALPCGFLAQDTIRILYENINNMEELEISGQTFLQFNNKGKKYSILASHLPNKEAYISVKNKLLQHCS